MNKGLKITIWIAAGLGGLIITYFIYKKIKKSIAAEIFEQQMQDLKKLTGSTVMKTDINVGDLQKKQTTPKS